MLCALFSAGGVELRRRRRENSSHISRSHFHRQELSRQSSDRLPHRPAPPVPVPGQKPVHRSTRRFPNQSAALQGTNMI